MRREGTPACSGLQICQCTLSAASLLPSHTIALPHPGPRLPRNAHRNWSSELAFGAKRAERRAGSNCETFDQVWPESARAISVTGTGGRLHATKAHGPSRTQPGAKWCRCALDNSTSDVTNAYPPFPLASLLLDTCDLHSQHGNGTKVLDRFETLPSPGRGAHWVRP